MKITKDSFSIILFFTIWAAFFMAAMVAVSERRMEDYRPSPWRRHLINVGPCQYIESGHAMHGIAIKELTHYGMCNNPIHTKSIK